MKPIHATILHRSLSLLIACCLAFSTTLALPHSVQATQFLAWEDGAGVASFGSNEGVIIDVGAIQYMRGCPVDGINDFVYPFADIYITRIVPKIGSGLVDASGEHNPVGGTALSGAFVNQLLGVTAPSGNLGAGTYTVVYDECQDGVLGPEDAVFANAFEVAITSDVPSLPPYITQMKQSALQQGVRLKNQHAILNTAYKVQDVGDTKDAIMQLFKPSAAELATILAGKLVDDVTGAFGISPEEEALATVLNAAGQYLAIANDPPDPDFEQMTLLPPVERRGAAVTEPLAEVLAEFGSEGASEAAIGEALLHALERYQGAQAVGSGEWALVQAQAIRTYALLLADHQLFMQAAVDALSNGLAAYSHDYDAAELEAWRTGVVNSGFDAVHLQTLRNLDLGNREIAELHDQLRNTTLNSYTKSVAQTELTALKEEQAATRSSMLTMANAMLGVIDSLEALPTLVGGFPSADAGGPYAATVGITMTLNASASAVEGSTLEYTWDLDGDGEFGDAKGIQPGVAFDRAFTGYVGLLVTDNTGRQAVDYARIAATGGNRSP